jgi:hypothetical protein
MPCPQHAEQKESGLRNQPKATASSPDIADESQHEAEPSKLLSHPEMAPKFSQSWLVHNTGLSNDEMDDNVSDDDGRDPHLKPDSIKPCWNEKSDGEDEQYEDEVVMANIANMEFQEKMVALAVELGDDPRDEDWVAGSLRRKYHRVKKGELAPSIKDITILSFVKHDHRHMSRARRWQQIQTYPEPIS